MPSYLIQWIPNWNDVNYDYVPMISICSASFICHLIINLNILHPFSTKKHPGVPALEAQTMATSFDAFATLIAVTPLVTPLRH